MIVATIEDLGEQFINRVLDRATAIADGSPSAAARSGSILGLLFLDTSLRTRVGFAAAAGKMGIAVVQVDAPRANDRSVPESLDHTLRVLAGYTDVVVARVPCSMSQLSYTGVTPVINGGDSGPSAEHPTQALIDIFAIERQTGRKLADLTVAICGDLTMRSPRSLLAMLGRRPPRELLLVTDFALGKPHVPDAIRAITRFVSLSEVGGVDVLYVAGIPHQALPEPNRSRLIITPDILAQLHDDSVVLSPMPVIDEMTSIAMLDPRVGFFRQSDDALSVRIAVLEVALSIG